MKHRCLRNSFFIAVFVTTFMLSSCRSAKIIEEEAAITPDQAGGDLGIGQVTTENASVNALQSEKGLETIYFPFDVYNLPLYDPHNPNHLHTYPQYQKKLLMNALWLKNHPDVVIQIEGHCDERGTVEYNMALGERRAQFVLQFYVVHGISPERISIVSFGKERPLRFGHTEKDYAMNRRAVSVALKK